MRSIKTGCTVRRSLRQTIVLQWLIVFVVTLLLLTLYSSTYIYISKSTLKTPTTIAKPRSDLIIQIIHMTCNQYQITFEQIPPRSFPSKLYTLAQWTGCPERPVQVNNCVTCRTCNGTTLSTMCSGQKGVIPVTVVGKRFFRFV